MPDQTKQRRLRPSLAGATACVALVSSTVALVFTLFPSLRPDPRDAIRADVQVVSMDEAVTLREYLRRRSLSDGDFERRRDEYLRDVLGPSTDTASMRGVLRLRGYVAYVSSSAEGMKGRSVVLRWSLYAAQSRRRVTSPLFSNVSAVDLGIEAPTDRSVQEIWIPPTPGRGRYFVRVSLYDTRDVLLAVADGPPFQGRRGA